TETTIWSTSSRIRAGEAITIGRPIANTVIRILDDAGQLAPIGVAGELYIGGDGVAAGYLGRQDLTAERFVADPVAASGLLYRTGDLARYKASGEIEFLGRADFQVKLNGYRIELGEIEAALGRHEQVGQAVVMAREDDSPARLVAYVTSVQSGGSSDVGAEQVSRWENLWDGAYRQAASVSEPRFNTAGWTDSATGAQIPREQMLEWLDEVERSIVALKPKRVLEIGFGTGMVLYRVLPHVEHYTGVDLSSHALNTIEQELTPEERQRVALFQQPAHALEGIADRSCDTVVINSVAQYFPDAAYLAKVLRRASEIVADGGSIFVGDVRSLEQFEAFHMDVALQQSPEGSSKSDVASRLERRIAQDGELVLAESFFHALLRELPRASRVEVRLKPGRARNEMSAFRYDVVIRFGAKPAQKVSPIVVQRRDLLAALNRGESAILVKDVLNARVAGLHAARAALAGSGTVALAQLRALAGSSPEDAVEPMELAGLHPYYIVDILPARSGDAARFDAVFRNRAIDPSVLVDAGAPQHDKAPAQYARNPRVEASGTVSVDDLRAHLRGMLPEYMVPSTFVMLGAFPLTPNGKIDRKALPRPVQVAAPAVSADYVAPTNSVEETISDVWKSLLGIERVGLRDNIFDLGANSLLTVQANQRLSSLLDRKIALVSMFRYPTVEALAAHLSEGQDSGEAAAKRTQDRDARKKDAAERRRELRASR
ncbi:MAG: methyltransferase domain-containing protein, partial [Burkholderiales bacterium]